MQTIVIAALRVKNESRWIAEVLKSVMWCKEVILFDDNSTDDTREISGGMGVTVLPSPYSGLDEARDKEYLTREIYKKHGPAAWCLMIDGDEILVDGGELEILRAIRERRAKAYSLPIHYLWDSRSRIRVDGVYGKFSRPSLFQVGSSHGFRRTEQNGHLHCSSVPACHIGKALFCAAALLHLGYMDRADRIRKWRYYNGIDPTNSVEGFDPAHPERGSYPWIVQGDIPEVPASARLLHAGPLETRAL